ncbi:MAG: cytochrome-c oxidase, cbb3-type subunit II, partial [Planctomycetes bacterium]|nr:cytochrome-c oxidase, cbb3-type subunit II [Planctomycetota bacterium]
LFSLMLWAPSWGGMLNGLLTLRGAWNKVRTDPVLKFFVAGVTFYGMATFEGPLLSIKAVSALGHYTDWIIGHVHSGALGWNGFMAAGLFYWLVPKLYGTKLHSQKMADYHFWIGIFGILLYVASMWVSGISQGLMWRAELADGGLQYPDWNAIINSQQLMYLARSIGGGMFIVGWLMMIWNLVATAMSGRATVVETEVTVLKHVVPAGEPSTVQIVFSKPVVLCLLGMVAATMFAMPNIGLAVLGFVLLAGILMFAAGMLYRSTGQGRHTWHERLESRPLAFALLTLIAVVVGGVFELLPGLVTDKVVPLAANGQMCVQPYTALELTGRDIFVREGCYVCHSQMIRPFRSEQIRYGAPSRIEESMWDHPFQWGSKRTGPDLARVGLKYNEAWHWDHMLDPRYGQTFSLGENMSIMPAYPWLYDDQANAEIVADKMRVLKKLGTPYTDEQVANAVGDYAAQAARVCANLATQGKTDADPKSEIVALIAYLMRLGRNLEPAGAQAASIEGGR